MNTVEMALQQFQVAVGDGEVAFGGNAPKHKPWVQHFLIAGSVIAATSAVALAILGVYAMAFISLGLCAIDILGAYYAPRKSLEEIIENLKQMADRLSINRNALQIEDHKWEEMLKTEKAQKEIDRKIIASLQLQLEQKTKELENTALKLEINTKEYEKISKIAEQIKVDANKTLANTQNVVEVEKKASQDSSSLTKEVTVFKSGLQDLDTLVTHLESGHKDRLQIQTQIKNSIAKLVNQIEHLQTLCHNKEKEIVNLQELNTSIHSRNQELRETQEHLEKVVQSSHITVEEKAALNQKIAKLIEMYRMNKTIVPNKLKGAK